MAQASTEPAAIDERTVVRRHRRTGTVVVDRAAVIVDEPGGRTFALNPTATIVWDLLDGTGDLGELIDDLATEFATSRARVAVDVVDLARQLARLGLLDGYDPVAGAWPDDSFETAADGCLPDGSGADSPTFDERYLASPPNG